MNEKLSKRGFKPIVILLLIGLICCCCIMSLMCDSTKETYAIELPGNNTYFLGDRLHLTNDTVVFEGQEYTSDEVMLICPNGTIYVGDTTVILSQIGNYQIVYTVNGTDKVIKITKTLTVVAATYQVSSENSKAEFTDKMKMVQKRAGYSAEESDINKSGIYVELSEGATFSYNVPIDVTDFGLDTPLLRIYPYNRSSYLGDDGLTYDAYSVIIRLTDCYDSTNYVDIEISYEASDTTVPDMREPYLRAGASNQIRTGFSETSPTANVGDRKSFYIGEQRYVAATKTYGARDRVNWVVNADDNGFEFYYDDATKCIYQKSSRFYLNYSVDAANGTYYYVNYIRNNASGNYVYDSAERKYITVAQALAKNPDLVINERFDYLGYYLSVDDALARDADYATTPNVDLTKYKQDGYRKGPVATTLIADLDNADAFDDIFKGFTTGEVFLSVTGENYVASHLRFEIDEIGGVEGEALNAAFVADKKAPVIVLENDKISTEAPNYIIKGKAVSVPSIAVYDANIKDSRYEVYYEYGTDFQRLVGVVNGQFVPLNIGTYTVMYIAQDRFGNTTRLPLNFTSVITDSNQTVDLQFTPLTGNIVTGEKVKFPEYQLTALNGKDNAWINIYAIYEDGSTIQIDADDLEITFENAGEYKIVFEYGDMFVGYTDSYNLSVNVSDNILFGEIVLPEYFIKDATYTLDKVSAFSFNEKYKTEVKTDVYVSEDGKEYAKIDPLSYTVNAQTSVRFKYVYREAYVESKSTIPVVDVGFGNRYKLDKYFAGDFVSDLQYNGIEFISNTSESENKLAFINILSLKSFAFQFTIPSGKGNFNSLEIKLVDFYDRSNEINLVYAKGTAGVEFNGTTVEGVFENYTRSLSYSQGTSSFVGIAGEKYRIENNFVSDKILCYFTLKGINGESSLFIRALNGQSFSNTDYDYGSPTIYYDEHAKGNKSYGDVVQIIPGIPNDVLCPYNQENFSFVMLDPNGNYVVAQDGTVLNAACDFTKTYSVVLNVYGTYKVNYYYEDNCGNSANVFYLISVVDETKPTLTINGISDKHVTAKLGSDVTVQEYTAQDNLSSSDKIRTYILICTPKGEMYQLSGNTFSATLAGEYTVIYYCYDENGNYAVEYYTVSVG